LETLTLDKELRLSTLLDKQDSDPLGDLHLPPQYKHKGPKRPRRHLQEDRWADNRRSDHKDNQRDPRVASHHRTTRRATRRPTTSSSTATSGTGTPWDRWGYGRTITYHLRRRKIEDKSIHNRVSTLVDD